MRTVPFILIALFLVLACQPEKKQKTSTATFNKTIIGVWETVSIKVDVKTADNRDSSYVFRIDEADWETQMDQKPVKTVFEEKENRYYSEFRSSGDSLLMRHRGVWNMFGDTIIMIEPNATYQYKIDWNEDGAVFSSYMDWDGDGAEDDWFEGVYRRIE